MLLFEIGICVFVEEVYVFPSGYLLFPYVLLIVVRYLIYSKNNSKGEYCALNDFIVIILRIFCGVQLITIVMKLESDLSWDW